MLLFLFACGNEAQQEDNATQQNQEVNMTTDQTPGYNANKNAYFGDLHIHTSWSFDAFIYNVRSTPDDAYAYGKGEEINHVSGEKIKIGRPLDFMAVTDHAEYMGIMMQLGKEGSPMADSPMAKELISKDVAVARKAFNTVGISMAVAEPLEELLNTAIIKDTWKRIVETADRHYQPGTFTTFPAYEWTSVAMYRRDLSAARNLHRNVIFKTNKVPERPFSCFDSQDPEALWEWMEKQRTNGSEVTAIPHNANMSDGLLYAATTHKGEALTAAYAKSRMRNEPVSEVSQIKGTAMSHPDLSPDDEFADFELYNLTFGDSPQDCEPKGSYVRQALKDGLAFKQELGVNPYKFGFIGSTDGHNASSPLEENNFTGKIGVVDGTMTRRLQGVNENQRWGKWSAGSLAGVWAEENTRDAIFDAINRKEVFATSGPRIKLRFFGGYDLEESILNQADWEKVAYSSASPMGSDLSSKSSASGPSFLVWAVKDPESGNLDRLQIIKGWIDGEGQSQEKVFEVSWAGKRQLDDYGHLSAIGNTVDVATATYTNTIGAVELKAIWKDPEFSAEEDAFYYVRVLEIPTPRWNVYDAKAAGESVPAGTVSSIQERAWSSPIWYTREN